MPEIYRRQSSRSISVRARSRWSAILPMSGGGPMRVQGDAYHIARAQWE